MFQTIVETVAYACMGVGAIMTGVAAVIQAGKRPPRDRG